MYGLKYIPLYVLILVIVMIEFSAAFELARTDVGCVFAKQGGNNVERIQCSKYFQALLQKAKANASEQLVCFSISFTSLLCYSILFLAILP